MCKRCSDIIFLIKYPPMLVFIYETLQCGDLEKLIKKRRGTNATLYYICNHWGYIWHHKDAHIATGHGGRDRMVKEINRKYANKTTKAIELYKCLCEEKKRKRPMTKGVVVKPIITKEFSSGGSYWHAVHGTIQLQMDYGLPGPSHKVLYSKTSGYLSKTGWISFLH